MLMRAACDNSQRVRPGERSCIFPKEKGEEKNRAKKKKKAVETDSMTAEPGPGQERQVNRRCYRVSRRSSNGLGCSLPE